MVEVKRTFDDAVGIYKEVTGFWNNFSNFFKTKATPKPVAQKKSAYVAVDEIQIKAGIVKDLTAFFKLQTQLADHIREEELKSKTVYDPNENLMEAALNRVMAAQQMAELEKTIRETMIYQTPGMGDLYTQVFATRDVIQEEQENARLAQEVKERQHLWRQREDERNLRLKLAWVLATSIFLLYLWLWLLLLNRWQKT